MMGWQKKYLKAKPGWDAYATGYLPSGGNHRENRAIRRLIEIIEKYKSPMNLPSQLSTKKEEAADSRWITNKRCSRNGTIHHKWYPILDEIAAKHDGWEDVFKTDKKGDEKTDIIRLKNIMSKYDLPPRRWKSKQVTKEELRDAAWIENKKAGKLGRNGVLWHASLEKICKTKKGWEDIFSNNPVDVVLRERILRIIRHYKQPSNIPAKPTGQDRLDFNWLQDNSKNSVVQDVIQKHAAWHIVLSSKKWVKMRKEQRVAERLVAIIKRYKTPSGLPKMPFKNAQERKDKAWLGYKLRQQDPHFVALLQKHNWMI